MRRLKKSLALLIALAMVLSTFAITVVSAQTFSDTSGHWAESLIGKWSDNGVINGYEEGTFRPDDYITRAELAKIISTAKQYTNMADIAFSDVAGDEWYVSDLKKCVAQGVIGGYEDGTFRPDNYITREEASAMFVRAYNINATALLNFADSADVSEWAKTAVTALVGANVIGGYEDGTFRPAAPITRAEVVKILDGAVNAEVLFPQATGTTSGTNSVATIGNLGNMGGGSGGGGGGNQPLTSFNVVLNANGGKFSNNAATKTINVGKNGVIGSRAEEPVREDMLFAGWYTSADAANQLIKSKKWDISSPVNRSMALYAGWYVDGKVVVSFETNGGTPAVPAQTIDAGSTAAEPSVKPARAHYQFAGWYTENTGGSKVNFDARIKVNTRYYARWTVDADYAAQEITIPTETVGSYKNGTVEAVPPSVIPGETVTISITAPEGFEVEGIPAIKYVSSLTGEEMTVDEAAIKYNEATDEYSFVMPANVQNNSMSINPHYVTVLPTEKPLPPTPTINPEAPTKEPVLEPTYKFNDEAFEGLTVLPANKEVGGLTANKESSIVDSGKTFTGSGYKYSKCCKIGMATLSFKVNGTCQIMIDAVSANNSENREYTVSAGSTSLGSFTCVGRDTKTGIFNYTGGAETITIKPAAGINLYGIFVNYNAEVPTMAPVPSATPEPTVDPNRRYNINIADNIQNGSVVVKSGSVSSDAIDTVSWVAADNVPAGAVEGQTPVFGVQGAATVNLNGVDTSYGTLTLYEEAHYYDWVWDTANGGDGKTYRYIRGENNPSVSTPFTENNQPGGAVFRYDAAKDGYITLEIYAFTNKHLHLYDNNAQSAIEDFTTGAEAKHTFTFSCEQSNSYYFWADGSKIGIISATYSSGILNAKAGDVVTVTTKPNDGYKTDSVFTEPSSAVSAGTTANTYTFKMPASDTTVNATFGEIVTEPKSYKATLNVTGAKDGAKLEAAASQDAEVLAAGDNDKTWNFAYYEGSPWWTDESTSIEFAYAAGTDSLEVDGIKIGFAKAADGKKITIGNGGLNLSSTGNCYVEYTPAVDGTVAFTVKSSGGAVKGGSKDDANDLRTVLLTIGSGSEETLHYTVAADEANGVAEQLEKSYSYAVKAGEKFYLKGGTNGFVLSALSFTEGAAVTDPTVTDAPATDAPATDAPTEAPKTAKWIAIDHVSEYDSVYEPEAVKIGDLTMGFLPDSYSVNTDAAPGLDPINGVQGSTNISVSDENTAPDSGSAFKFTTAAKGNVKLKIWFYGVKMGSYRVLKCAEGQTAGELVVDVPGDGTQNFYDSEFAVEPGYEYYAYVDGTRIAINTVEFIPSGAEKPADPTDAPNVYTFLEGTTVNYVGEAATDGEIAQVVVTAADGSNVEVNGTSFVMPAQDVTVTVTYVDAASLPTAEPTPTAAPTAEPTPSANPNKWTYDASLDGCAAGTELIPGLTTLFTDKVDSKKYLTSDDNGSFDGTTATGTALKYVASANGTLSVGITGLGTIGTNGKPKIVYLVEEGGSQDSPIAKLENLSTTDKLDGEVTGAVEAGKTYYIYGAGTKACFISALFTPAQ